jgi:hypothetical protein
MKLRRVNSFLLAILFVLLTACSLPSLEGDTLAPDITDVQEVPDDGAANDGKGDLGTDDARPDETPEDIPPKCEDPCTLGEMKCDDVVLDRYVICVELNGCLQWDEGNWVECMGQGICACEALEAECKLVDGEECVCIADCEGKECGPDGCGGTCWEGEGEECGEEFCDITKGICDVCTTICNEDETLCNGDEVQYCVNKKVGTGEEPCWQFGTSEPCPGDGQICNPDDDKCVCEIGDACGDACCDEGAVCFAEACCTPDCEGIACGDDGCGGSCGECATGTCEEGGDEYCNSGVCECECKSVGCTDGDTQCDGDGYQECALVQAPDCTKWSPTYGCPVGEKCNPETDECACIPDCSGKECGSDGCDGNCGDCDLFYDCKDGECDCTCDGVPFFLVCDTENNVEYDNECEAICNGLAILQVKPGPCPKCQDDCTEEDLQYGPVCGYDNVSYATFCDLKCSIGGPNCTTLNNCVEMLHLGECVMDCCEEIGCDSNYDPVCGTDGITYCNPCSLFGCPDSQDTAEYCKGECLDETICPDCTDECDNKCGMHQGNRKNFMNSCLLECQAADELWAGDCCLECSLDQFEPVCASNGTDFKIFQSACFQQCLGWTDNLVYLYDIPTLPNGDDWNDLCEECKCDISTEETEVCGDNYVTYANTCAMECHAGSNPDNPPVGLVPECDGPCFSEECPCPTDLMGLGVAGLEGEDDPGIRGVCGADGNTYGNECHAAKYGTFVVSQIWCSECADECIMDEYKPVCCDGVTYANTCISEKCNDYLPVCQKGKCCTIDEDCDDSNPETTDQCNGGVCENL